MTATRIALFGSHPLGEACLDELAAHDGVSVETVVTYPPDHDGWWDGSLYDYARDRGYPVLPIAREDEVRDIDIDYLVSVYYPNILGPDLLDHPEEGALNLHQAELPRYRGSNVFSHAIMNARRDDHWRYGTTLHFMAEEVDAGDIVARNFVPITETDTARDLYCRTRAASVALFAETIDDIVSGRVHEMRTPQSAFPGERYFYTKESLDGTKEIDPAVLATDDPEERLALYDRIRALDFPPHEPAWTRLGDRKVYLTANDTVDADTASLTALTTAAR
jgi:methionyl-tRNA formyltransferase